MATQNNINRASGNLTIDPGASGDSFVQFDINTTGEFRIGIDDDASDAFKISQGSALGTNDTFIMTASGERTMPLQPAFMAYLSSDADDVTGDGTNYGPIIFDTEVIDKNSDYDHTSGQFTAPVDGVYSFSANVTFHDVGAANTLGYLSLITSNGTYTEGDFNAGAIRSTINTLRFNCSEITEMDSADTAEVNLYVSGGTLIIDINGSSLAIRRTVFSGTLLS